MKRVRVSVGDGDWLGRGTDRVETRPVADVADVDEHAEVVACLDHPVTSERQPAVVGLIATRSEVIGNVVGELDALDADVAEDAEQFRIVADHRRVLEPEQQAEHTVVLGLFHLGDRSNDPHDVGVVANQVAHGADSLHGSGGVLPDANGRMHNVDPARANFLDHRTVPVVDLKTVDSHSNSPSGDALSGRAGIIHPSSNVPSARSWNRGAP